MRNLYSITTNQEAIQRLFRAINRYVGNLPPLPSGGQGGGRVKCRRPQVSACEKGGYGNL